MANPSYTGIKEGTAGILFKMNLAWGGTYEFHTYSLTMMMGMLAAILTIVIFWGREKYKFEHLMGLILLTIPFAMIGARAWHLVEEKIYHPEFDMSRWYAIWEGGLSIQGGVVLATIVDLMYVYAHRDQLDIRKASSIIIPTILIGQVIGRWGNFANHEIYGRVDWDGSSLTPLGESIKRHLFISDAISDQYGVSGLYRYPLFFYEGIANLIGYIILVWIINNFGLMKPGATAFMYFLWYGTVRGAMEPLREKNYDIYSYASYIFIAIGALGMIYLQFFSFVHYKWEWRKYRFVYQYAHPEKYNEFVERTTIFKKWREQRQQRKVIKNAKD